MTTPSPHPPAHRPDLRAPPPASPVHVIGASGRSGSALCRALLARGNPVIAVVRDLRRLPADLAALCADARVADLTDDRALAAALSDARAIASTAHARHIPAILRATEAAASGDRPTLVALGSTRKFTRWPDAHANGVLAGERALLASGRDGILLHPTMIYGAQGEDNVQRLAALLGRLPLVPLPAGGRALVQPIYQDDVTRSMIAALDRMQAGSMTGPHSIVIAGATALSYRAFAAAVAHAAGVPRRMIVPVPASLLMALAPLTKWLPGLPGIGRAEVRRLLEDKAFDTAPMRQRLGIAPIALQAGLTRLFSPERETAAAT